MSLFARRRGRPGPPPAISSPADAPDAPDTSATEGIVELHDERLPSRVPSIFFTVHIDGAWYVETERAHQYRDPVVLARHRLREHARRTLSRYTVLETPAAQDVLNQAIARPLNPGAGLTAYGVASLTVADSDRNLAEEHQHRQQQGDLERQDVFRRLAFLQRILSDPGLRTVWWIDRYPERIGDLKNLATAVSDVKAPHDSDHDTLRDEIVRFVDQLLADIRTPQQHEVFLRALTSTLQALGSTELQRTAAHWLPTGPTDPGGDTA
ncbi:hypothetical protein RVR_4668 [Actinacidiphila reveromycinica]|uniref:Uncharacterized protein n=1 Tax=Actinacidiphila reveromycinica TaxID=659352 RepID=A0A7U3UTQ5_9ACTN|nr:hypothetical protein [Streptomyces sp. SN-593]BBA98478.1 hypothetical protein RVR_4668 [Streptomyces sp. SN-593]